MPETTTQIQLQNISINHIPTLNSDAKKNHSFYKQNTSQTCVCGSMCLTLESIYHIYIYIKYNIYIYIIYISYISIVPCLAPRLSLPNKRTGSELVSVHAMRWKVTHKKCQQIDLGPKVSEGKIPLPWVIPKIGKHPKMDGL